MVQHPKSKSTQPRFTTARVTMLSVSKNMLCNFPAKTVTGNNWWSFWIGGSLNETDGKWYWVNGDEVGSGGYTNWADGQVWFS